MDTIDLDAIITKVAVDMAPTMACQSYKTVTEFGERVAREAIHRALVLASKRASLERYYPDEGCDMEGKEPHEDNYEASYSSPYTEDSGCTIWVDKRSILEVEKLVK